MSKYSAKKDTVSWGDDIGGDWTYGWRAPKWLPLWLRRRMDGEGGQP